LRSLPSLYSNTVENIRTKEYGYDDVVRKLKEYIPERQKALEIENAIILKLSKRQKEKVREKLQEKQEKSHVNIASQKDERDKDILKPNAGQSNVKRQK